MEKALRAPTSMPSLYLWPAWLQMRSDGGLRFRAATPSHVTIAGGAVVVAAGGGTSGSSGDVVGDFVSTGQPSGG